MRGTKEEQFRITTWPGTIVPIPPRSSFALVGYRLDRTRTVLIPTWDDYRERPRATNDVEGETYLRLTEVDLHDPDSILAFVNRFGILQVEESRMTPPVGSMFLHAAIGEVLMEERVRARAIVREEFPERWEKDSTHEQIASDDYDIETLAEFRVGAALIRDAVKAWRWMAGTVDAVDLTWESLGLLRAAIEIRDVARTWRRTTGTVEASDLWESPDLLRHIDHREVDNRWLATLAVEKLSATIDFALAPFHPSLSIGSPDDDQVMRGSSTRVTVAPETGFRRSQALLYSVCCLELYNHIVEQAEPRTCANETCGRLFVHQSGRAQQGQYRSKGVLYCDVHCAKAQAQRMYRRRKRRTATVDT